jgi:hypothetical protein
MGANRSQVQKSAASGTESDYLRDWASYNQIKGTLSSEQKTAALSQRSEFARTTNTNTGNSNKTQGSILDIGDVRKAGEGTSRISQFSDQFKTGLESEFDFANAQKLQDAILKQLKLESDLHNQINEGMGLTGELSELFRNSLVDTLPEAARLGYDIGNITEMMLTLTENSGKFNIIAQNTLERGFQTARAFGMTLPQLATAFGEFEKVGLGASDALDRINTAGLESASLGLNAKKTTTDLRDNLSKLNEYGFKSGVEGLNRMVQKSAEFRMNMAETFKVADKVMNPESAIELTANMQMLGGAVGDLNDPLKLMYMATNNVEGLQDAIQGAAATLATYNTEQKRFEITGANIRRGKEMAAQLGISYSEFAKGATAAQERLLATDTLLARGFNMDDKEKEFLTNLASMKDGEMQIVVPKSLQDSLGKELGKNEVKLSDLTNKQVEALKKYQDQLEEKTPEDMAKEMFTETQKIANNTASTAQALTTGTKRISFGKKDDLSDGENKPIIKLIKALGTLRETQAELSKDPKFIEGEVKKAKGLIDAVTKPLEIIVEDMTKSFEKLNEELKKTLRSPKTTEQEKIDIENKKRQESAKPSYNDNAYMFNANLKVTHIGLGNNMTVDQTEKGYLTPMRNMG